MSENTEEAISPDTIVIYEHKGFSEDGRVRTLHTSQCDSNTIISLHDIHFKDCMFSLKWNLPERVKVIFYEHSDGRGRRLEIENTGENDDTHNNNFGDCASSWEWTRF